MASFNEPGTIVITCYPYQASYLAQEVESLGLEITSTQATSVITKGTLEDCIRMNYGLRTASRVLFTLRSFPAENISSLYEGVTAFPWEKYIDTDGYFSVTSSASHPDVRNTMFLNMRVKDAIADRFMKNFSKRPDSGGEKRGFSVHVLWKDNVVNLSIDTSGESLSKHGYRLHPFKAPLQESLASGILAATGWDSTTPLILPMCGSGTLAIEAALLAKGIYPGQFRDRWAFMNIKGYSAEMLQNIREAFNARQQPADNVVILASDQDRQAIDAARKNAAEAGVADMIRFETCDFQSATVPAGKGTVIINPPYGTRLGEIRQLEELYKRIGEFLKKQCTGKTAYILTPEKQLADSIGLRSTAKIPFMNADIECRLLKYDIYEGSKKAKKPDA